MSLKAKLVSTIAAVCMVICLLSVGIFAASTGTVNVGGTVSFVASDVDVTVNATIAGGDTTTNAQTKSVTWNAASTDDAMTADWSNLTLNFVKGQQITISLEVINNSTERSVDVTLGDNGTTATNYTHADSLTEEKDTLTKVTDGAETNKATYTITLTVTDWNKLVTGTLNYQLVVTNVA